ncbi:[citrate (pro-3S)-lyase] ligase [Oenococcus sp. UCMA 16435]|nr:[citrate (pro-3S)-lyase] ligase [Oenococcus sp. UCMA 16435]MDI4584657.1 [citrate (pro-3S)-lyase] ligase [Oenococcus sp. UCMA 14587]
MQIKNVSLKNKKDLQIWEEFLTEHGINNFGSAEISKVDETIALFEDRRMLATGSLAGNVLKYIAVESEGSSSEFNTILSQLTNLAAGKGIFHLFVFTKPKYSKAFQFIGFKELAQSSDAALLESGDYLIGDYLAELPRVVNQGEKKIAGIVMNANPFTKGHRYLVEKAASENDYVYVFVVSTDASLFNSEERLQLVKKGTTDLKNVFVVSGGDYMVSYATFPAYFLASDQTVIEYQTTLDALIFKNQIAPALNIQTRFLGEEPFSKTTGIYNQVLKKVLPPIVAVKIIPRAKTQFKTIITATKVRQLIAKNNLVPLKQFLPSTTIKYVEEHKDELQLRIKKGININGN